MPQLDLNWFIPQLFWLAVTFILLFAVMAKVSLPRLERAIVARKDKVADDVSKAEAAKQQAETLEKEYTRALSAAQADAEKVVTATIQRTVEKTNKDHAELDKALAKKLSEAELRIAEMRSEAARKIMPYQAEISQMIAEKLANIKVSDEKATSTVNLMMKGIK